MQQRGSERVVGAMTSPDAAPHDPAIEHTTGARRAIQRNDLGALIRHVIGWLHAITSEGTTTRAP